MKNFKNYFERKYFGVCDSIAQKVGFSSSSVRLFFIYCSFITFGSPVILYIMLAFTINVRKYLRQSRSTIWDI